jgi:2,4'-dihydroxyacetophenone dioxygenase
VHVDDRPGRAVPTLVVPDDVKEMATLFHVTGGYTYVDPYGEAL